jgi:hypothetical protein
LLLLVKIPIEILPSSPGLFNLKKRALATEDTELTETKPRILEWKQTPEADKVF